MKTWWFSLYGLFIILGLPVAVQAQDGTIIPRKPDIAVSFFDVTVNNMPFSIRNVPAHPDDGGGFPGAIDRTRYDTSVAFSVGYPLVRSRAGRGAFALKLRLAPLPNGGMNIAERNYTNAPGTDQRGYGAALTFVGLQTRGILPSFKDTTADSFTNIIPELVYEFPAGKGKVAFVTLGYYQLQAVTGWDRYDSLQVKDVTTLAHVFPLTVGMRFRSFQIGLRFSPLITDGVGSSAGISGQNPTLTLGWTF